MTKKSLLLLGIILMGASLANLSAKEALAPNVEKKFLQFGWDNPSPAYLDKNLEMIETYLPYDGLGIGMAKTVKDAKGKNVSTSWMVFSKLKFQYDWYKKDVEHLKNVHKRAKKLKYNFIGTSASSFTGEFDLFDDEFWKIACNNFAILARVAKEGGCKGLRFDLEDYGNYQKFRYRAECGRSYKEAWDKARERGRQWMNAVGKEFPDITIFCFFWLDLMMGYADGSPYLHERLQGCSTGLLVAFINGIYDALPPKAKIVDSMEGHGYFAHKLEHYYKMRALRDVRYVKLLAPENHRKFREQGSFSVASYMSCYTNSRPPYSFREFMEKEKMTPLEFFRRNFTYAVEYSDEYVWTWNEHRKWYPIPYKHGWQENALKHSPDVPGPYIGMAIPGIENAMLYAKDPWKYAQNLLKNPAKLVNLLKNASFEGKGGKSAVQLAPDSVVYKNVPNWETWKNKRSKAKISFAPGKGVNKSHAVMVENGAGVIHQAVKIDPNGAYIVRAKMRVEGNGGGSLGVQWRNAKGQWHNHSMTLAAPFDKDLGNGWKQATVIIRNIPEGSFYLSPMLNSTGKEGTKVYFDDVEVFSMFEKNPSVAPHLKKALEDWHKKRAAEKKAAALKNVKKTPQAKENKVRNANFNLWGDYANADSLIPGATLFKGKFEGYSAKGKVKAKFFSVVGKDMGYSDDTSAVVTAYNGCILAHVPAAKGGEKYRIAVKTKGVGNGKGYIKVYYRSKRVKGPFDYGLGIPVFKEGVKLEKDGWKKVEGSITLPAVATGFTLVLDTTGIKGEKDMVFFDEVEAVKVP